MIRTEAVTEIPLRFYSYHEAISSLSSRALGRRASGSVCMARARQLRWLHELRRAVTMGVPAYVVRRAFPSFAVYFD